MDSQYKDMWSPFDPKWYSKAFDKFINTADFKDNQNTIIKDGFYLPDADGSKSSVFRNEAMLNNSFDENALIESLRDIYLNSTHKLVASNHDNTHFFKWHGRMSDVKLLPNTQICEFRIPWNMFIYQKERDIYKLSPFYKTWISVQDILNNWNIFKWHLMVFIDQKVYSEYEIFIDEQEVIIRFSYNDYWVKNDFSFYIYKFDTNFQKRILISRQLCNNQWDWKMPIEAIGDNGISNVKYLMATINKISDPEYRKDGQTRIEVLGDNIEFLEIKDGYIDLSVLSDFNKSYIRSEMRESLWMSIIVPKFFHEYPILLPTDTIHQPYVADFKPVMIDAGGTPNLRNVKSNIQEESIHQVYIDMNGKIGHPHDGWKQMIRPIVLSDAYINPFMEPYDLLMNEIRDLRDYTVPAADRVEDFRFFFKEDFTQEQLNGIIDTLLVTMKSLYDAYRAFYEKRKADRDTVYDFVYDKFLKSMDDIRRDGESSPWLEPINSYDDTFWEISSLLITIPTDLLTRYQVIEIIRGIERRHLWTDPTKHLDTIRFQRPVEIGDFWIFEYNFERKTWRPTDINIERHFPDVYLLDNDSNDKNRVLKAFFFYSDTMNVLEESRDVNLPTPSWDKDIIEYYQEPKAIYRDIFMEKFYWLGIQSIYKGLLMTSTRWEVLEYVMGNSSYQRFNELFLQTMDPYFKLGLATYLKSSNFEFPFDDAIDKFQEAITLDWNSFKKITNFEIYLNKQWIPSYFDYIVRIMDDWNWKDRLLKRPSSTFDMRRIKPIIIEIQLEIIEASKDVLKNLDWILQQLRIESYNLNISKIEDLKSRIHDVLDNMQNLLDIVDTIDVDIYSMDVINQIIDGLKKHIELVDKLYEIFEEVETNAKDNNIYKSKRALVNSIRHIMLTINYYINEILKISRKFDMNEFMLSTNDLNTYLVYDKYNPNDRSTIDHVNEFNDPWPMEIKDNRNNLFVSTAKLNSIYNPSKFYSNQEVQEFVDLVDQIKEGIDVFQNSIEGFWIERGLPRDQILIDKLEYSSKLISDFNVNMKEYIEARNALVDVIQQIYDLLALLDENKMSETEKAFRDGIIEHLGIILDSVSYIAGENRQDIARESILIIEGIVIKWLAFILKEEEVFGVIFETVGSPVPLLLVMDKNRALLESLMQYMDLLNEQYVPDTGTPNYAEVYEVDEIEILSKGFRHDIGDIVFVPGLGSYVVTEISDDIMKAELIELTGYRRTTFRDPMIQTMSYGSITNGLGSGIVIKPTSSITTPIQDDTVIIPYLTRTDNFMKLIAQYIDIYNPYNNAEFLKTLDDAEGMISKWNQLREDLESHVTISTMNLMNELFVFVQNLLNDSMEVIDIRSEIGVRSLLKAFETLIFDIYRYATSSEIETSPETEPFIISMDVMIQDIEADRITDIEEFLLFERDIRITYNNLYMFYGSGTSWNDVVRLQELLNDTIESMNIYRNNIFPLITNPSKVEGFETRVSEITENSSKIQDVIDRLEQLKSPILDGIHQVKEYISNIDITTLNQDLWYKITSINPALPGENYQIGDIVEIIPVIDDSLSEDIKEMIRNDTILIQIIRVESGLVTEIKPMLEYALPYSISGIRDTITRTGIGSGLTIDVFSRQITLQDSTLITGKDSYIPPFDENDLFMFKFENIHDLNIEYEVFVGGKQITNYLQRHEEVSNPLHPRKIDVVYVNANEVIGLQNSSIYIPGENYFVYRINDIEIKDPGAGYHEGQEVVIDTNQFIMRLKVAKLIYEPYKGIQEFDASPGNMIFNKQDPSGENLAVLSDTINNIDDEFTVSYYDQLTKDGIKKPAASPYPQDDYEFHSIRFDDLNGDDRNSKFMYPDVELKDGYPHGDPDYNWYQGNRVDNTQVPMTADRWYGIMNLNPPTDPYIMDNKRLPPNQSPRNEYQLFKQMRFHHKYDSEIQADFEVEHFSDLPKNRSEWSNGAIGKTVLVEHDETINGHRTLYKIRTFVPSGLFVYDIPVLADKTWNHIEVDWMNTDFYPDYPSIVSQYPSAPWRSSKSFQEIQREISEGKYAPAFLVDQENHTSYIHEMTLDDLSVFNWTTKEWEDLYDNQRWQLVVIDDPINKKWGFTLNFLLNDSYSYDMKFYWNKSPNNQMRNFSLKRDAVVDISAIIIDEVVIPPINLSVNTGRTLRIRKLFPYEQKETFIIGKTEDGNPLGYEMDFKLAPYMHFKNQLHLSDVKIFNRTAGRFENILDRKLFEVRFKDPKAINRGYETQTKIVQSLIAESGKDFHDGPVWGYNLNSGIHIFGNVTASLGEGYILSFDITHCPNPPTENISLEFHIYQNANQSSYHQAIVLVEFKTERVEVYGDGYIHDVSNPHAILPNEFKVIPQYDLDSPFEYDIIINKTPRKWTFINPNWVFLPTFHIPDVNISSNTIYLLNERGRFPLINPSTGLPTFKSIENDNGTDVTFLNLYRRYNHLEIRSMPYPMRSVYVQRRIPSSGYIDLNGKLNKPLNKKYFEFWVNGRLLHDEVTIITPSKLFLHGLKSLRNLEIVEINRDPNEYFSDSYLEAIDTDLSREINSWNYETYLDFVLEGKLDRNNYTLEEQEYLLSPVWKQVNQYHPDFKDYPPNTDEEDDIISIIYTEEDMQEIIGLDDLSYEFLLIDTPILEGVSFTGRNMRFEQFGWTPISNELIVELLNEEWEDEINNDAHFNKHIVISDDDWYGTTARLYDEYGILVHNLNEAVYKIPDFNLLYINPKKKITRIIPNDVSYDLT